MSDFACVRRQPPTVQTPFRCFIPLQITKEGRKERASKRIIFTFLFAFARGSDTDDSIGDVLIAFPASNVTLKGVWKLTAQPFKFDICETIRYNAVPRAKEARDWAT